MGVLMVAPYAESKTDLISHKETGANYAINIQYRLQESKDIVLPLEEELELLAEMQTFELGRFLLQNRGLNGYWTSYIISEAPTKKLNSALEEWIIHKAPVVLATRERFHIFQNQLQTHLRPEMKIASVPCGVMDDLLKLDYRNLETVSLLGIDLDQASLNEASLRVEKKNLANPVRFLKRNAWDLGLNQEVDILTSNGLNIYEASDDKVTALYIEFYKALKPGGMLITSFLTPPPAISSDSPWKEVNQADAIKQKAIFADIIQAQWQVFRSEETTREQLTKAGFVDIKFIYDKSAMFPTVIAYK